jgi:hypothetical protein
MHAFWYRNFKTIGLELDLFDRLYNCCCNQDLFARAAVTCSMRAATSAFNSSRDCPPPPHLQLQRARATKDSARPPVYLHNVKQVQQLQGAGGVRW